MRQKVIKRAWPVYLVDVMQKISPKALDEESWFVKRANREPQACCLNGRARKVKISNRSYNVNNPNWKELNSWIFTKNVGNEFGKIKPVY